MSAFRTGVAIECDMCHDSVFDSPQESVMAARCDAAEAGWRRTAPIRMGVKEGPYDYCPDCVPKLERQLADVLAESRMRQSA